MFPQALQKRVKRLKADLGIALDGDGDRILIVDNKGKVIDGDKIIFICAAHLKRKGELKGKVVATVMSNNGLKCALKREGISLIRTKVGDKYIIKKMKECKCNFGGEQSGHIIFRDYSTTGDGLLCALIVLRILQEEKTKIAHLASQIKLFPQYLLSVKVKKKKPFNKMPKLINKIKKAKRELKGSGRIIVRYSGTENKARVMVEAKEKITAKRIAKDIAKTIKMEIGTD